MKLPSIREQILQASTETGIQILLENKDSEEFRFASPTTFRRWQRAASKRIAQLRSVQ